MKKLFALAVCTLMSLSHFTTAKTVSNLGEVEKNIIYPEGKQLFAEHMNGVPQTNGFGSLLKEINTQTFIQWLAPKETPKQLTFIGVKKWGNDNLYIGTARFSRNEKDAIYLAVFKWQNSQFTPIARTTAPLDTTVSWHHSKLTAPARVENDTDVLLPQAYKRLDLAPYQLNVNTKAFGVWVEFFESYSGGGAFSEALQLYMVKGDQIINILSEPMYSYQDIAGDWNKDGTRQHDINESKNILKVLKTQTDGYNNLQIKSLDTKWQKIFTWSEKEQRYVTK